MSSGICVWHPSDTSNQRNISEYEHHFNSQDVGWVIRYPIHSHHWGLPNPCEFFLYLNYGHDMKPIGWWSYRVRVKCSLVLLEIFNHPCPTLVVTLNPTVTRSFREWLSYPFPCTNPEVIWKPISLRLSRTISIDLSKSFGVAVLFRQPHPLKVPNMRKKWNNNYITIISMS